MLICLPRSICSWDYSVRGAAGGIAYLTFNWFTEQGTIDWGDAEYRVVKHGPLSGHWTLEGPKGVLADAQKTSPFTRTFELQTPGRQLTLRARSMFTRAFALAESGALLGTIQPKHLFTRRATITCSPKVDELTQLFSFWLVVITWKRAAKNNNS